MGIGSHMTRAEAAEAVIRAARDYRTALANFTATSMSSASAVETTRRNLFRALDELDND